MKYIKYCPQASNEKVFAQSISHRMVALPLTWNDLLMIDLNDLLLIKLPHEMIYQ
jgi:hypothetical protein